MSISKSFSNLSVSEIASRIYDNLKTDKEIEIEDTQHLHNLIVPNLKPFDALTKIMSAFVAKFLNSLIRSSVVLNQPPF